MQGFGQHLTRHTLGVGDTSVPKYLLSLCALSNLQDFPGQVLLRYLDKRGRNDKGTGEFKQSVDNSHTLRNPEGGVNVYAFLH